MSQDRTERLVGKEGLERLRGSSVALFGLGGVGGYALESLARAGVGRLILVDADRVEGSNLNRQVLALRETVGEAKVVVGAERVKAIDPGIEVVAHACFAEAGKIPELLIGATHVIDAIDSLDSKCALLAEAHGAGLPVVACMGAARKLDPRGIRVDDISKTSHCPLARAVRLNLRKRGIRRGIPCVYTWEAPCPLGSSADGVSERVQGSISYLPGLIGLTAAGMLIREILGLDSAGAGC